MSKYTINCKIEGKHINPSTGGFDYESGSYMFTVDFDRNTVCICTRNGRIENLETIRLGDFINKYPEIGRQLQMSLKSSLEKTQSLLKPKK